MEDKIFTVHDMMRIEGHIALKDRIVKRSRKMGLKVNFSQDENDKPVKAKINMGRWVADCDGCQGAEYVSPDHPIFFCLSCGNYRQAGRVRHVIFPKDYEDIEAEILKRPVVTGGGNPIKRALEATAAYNEIGLPYNRSDGLRPLTRCWEPDETLADIKKQNKALPKGGGGRSK
jgi:hypothetical protein